MAYLQQFHMSTKLPRMNAIPSCKRRTAMAGNETVLVLGASGGIGGDVARQMREAGWQVRALRRGMDDAVQQRDGITWMRGDAMNRLDLAAAAQGSSVI